MKAIFRVSIVVFVSIFISISHAQQWVFIKITNLLDPRKTIWTSARIDTSESMLVLPRNFIIDSLGLKKIEVIGDTSGDSIKIRKEIYGPVTLTYKDRVGTFDVLLKDGSSKLIGKTVSVRFDHAFDSTSNKPKPNPPAVNPSPKKFQITNIWKTIVGKGNWEPSMVTNLGAYYLNGEYSLFSAGAGFGSAYKFSLTKKYPVELGFYLAPQASGDSTGDKVFVSVLCHWTFAKAIGIGLGWRVWNRGREFHVSNFKRSNAFFTLGYNLTNEHNGTKKTVNASDSSGSFSK